MKQRRTSMERPARPRIVDGMLLRRQRFVVVGGTSGIDRGAARRSGRDTRGGHIPRPVAGPRVKSVYVKHRDPFGGERCPQADLGVQRIEHVAPELAADGHEELAGEGRFEVAPAEARKLEMPRRSAWPSAPGPRRPKAAVRPPRLLHARPCRRARRRGEAPGNRARRPRTSALSWTPSCSFPARAASAPAAAAAVVRFACLHGSGGVRHAGAPSGSGGARPERGSRSQSGGIDKPAAT